MLAELHARDLGVIADLTLLLGPGMTAVTGETGAGKTLVVEAIQLLVGERADPALVRPGAAEARVEGRFLLGDQEIVVARAVPAEGRSRAYLDGRLVTATELSGLSLVDLHGQHAHQSLLSARSQRAALDRFGGVDLAPLVAARAEVAAIGAAQDEIGGDERARAREIDLLRYQLAELDAAAVEGPDEDERLAAEEDLLADAAGHRDAATEAYHALAGDGGAGDALGRAVAAAGGRTPLGELELRLRALAAEVAELAGDLRHAGETIVVDPERLELVRSRRRLLAELRRKYGERLSDVCAFAAGARDRLAALERHGERARALETQRAEAETRVAAAASSVAAARRRAAPELGAAVEARLQSLAMPGARFGVEVGGPDPADDVTFLLGANRGEPVLPLAKVGSGGELARAMLALRLVLTGAAAPAGEAAGEGPETLVFDEVDAGIGGQAATAVGRALAALAGHRQVLVVTHLPQVAAFADHHVAVTKSDRGGRTVAEARLLDSGARIAELSRMLSGLPSSSTARDHAEELLATAARARREEPTWA